MVSRLSRPDDNRSPNANGNRNSRVSWVKKKKEEEEEEETKKKKKKKEEEEWDETKP